MVTPEMKAQWKERSLATVVALQKVEQNILDAVSLSEAFGKKGMDEEVKSVLAEIAAVRTLIYQDRNKYAVEAGTGDAVVRREPPISPPRRENPNVGPGARPARVTEAPAEAAAVLPPRKLEPPGEPISVKAADVFLPEKMSAYIQNAVKQSKTMRHGALGDLTATQAFVDVCDDGVLIGLRCGTSKRDNVTMIKSVQPVFLTRKGIRLGQVHGDASVAPTIDLMAKEGYSVGGYILGSMPLDDLHPEKPIDALGLTFMRIEGDKLDTANTYQSQKVGSSSKTWKKDELGEPIIGIHGKTGGKEGGFQLGLISTLPSQ
jgi:hypothetical protein